MARFKSEINNNVPTNKAAFKSGPPPHIGWWNASINGHLNRWRWWDGEKWSMPARDTDTAEYAATEAAKPAEKEQYRIKWNPAYPVDARVPRIDPRSAEAATLQ